MATAPSTTRSEPDLGSILQAYNDVTERLKRSHDALGREVCRLRDELNEKNRELQRRERLAALGQMAAGVAHEIRNPLGGIGLFVSLLDRDLQDRPKQLEIVRKVAAGVSSMERIVNDILAFAGDADPDRQVVSVVGVIESALAQATPGAPPTDVSVEVVGVADGAQWYCDSSQVERALVNLLVNALEVVGSGGHVWVSESDVDSGDGTYCIVIEDDGPGIAPELMERVFNPFFTTKGTGTGLGLAIVHRIAESNGGFVRVGRSKRGGAAFVFGLPQTRTKKFEVCEGGTG